MDEKQLIRYLKVNKRLGQKALYENYADKMYMLSYRYITTNEDAEEVVMQGFLKVFQNINQFKYLGKGSLEAWMKKIMINEALMFLRKKRKFEINDDFEITDNIISDDFHDIDSEYIYKLITKLPIGYRTVFNMYVIEGMSHKEIAESLQIEINTSKSQLSKARKLLQKYLINMEEHYETA